jgi:hypothetical protein
MRRFRGKTLTVEEMLAQLRVVRDRSRQEAMLVVGYEGEVTSWTRLAQAAHELIQAIEQDDLDRRGEEGRDR